MRQKCLSARNLKKKKKDGRDLENLCYFYRRVVKKHITHL